MLKPPPEGRGEVISGDGSDDPFPGGLQAVLVQGGPRQGLLHSPKQEKVGRCQIQQIGRVLQDLDPLRRHPLFHAGSRMDRRVVPVEPPLLCGHGGPLLLKMLQEGAQDLDGVSGVDRGASGDDMGIDHPTQIEKRHDHLLGPTGVDPCLQRARLTPWDPLFALFFRLRRMVGHHGFVHGDDRVQHGLGSAVHGGDEV